MWYKVGYTIVINNNFNILRYVKKKYWQMKNDKNKRV